MHKYKVGDKVRVTEHFKCPEVTGLECTIVMVQDKELFTFPYRVQSNSTPWNCLMFDKEIEKVNQVGQQSYNFV